MSEGLEVVDHEALLRNPETGLETFEVGPKELLRVFGDKKFTNTLQRAARYTQNNGYESAFEVMLLADGTTYIEKIAKGGTGRVSVNNRSLKSIDGPLPPQVPRSNFLFLHFHPEVEDPISPSPRDLENASSGQSFSSDNIMDQALYSPYHMICIVDLAGNIRGRILRTPTLKVTVAESDDYDKNCISITSSERELHETLDGMGFQNELISFKKSSTGITLTPLSQAKITKLEPARTFKYIKKVV